MFSVTPPRYLESKLSKFLLITFTKIRSKFEKGVTTTFATGDGRTATVEDGIIIDIS